MGKIELPTNPDALKAIFNTGTIHLKDYADYLATMPISSEREYNVQQTVKYLLRQIAELKAERGSERRRNMARVKITLTGFTLCGDYYIEHERINTEVKLLKWIQHLLEKDWVDKELLV